jgi:hypothetical protein
MALPAKTNIRVDALLDSAQRNLEAAKLNAYPSSIVDSVLSCLVEGLACTMLNQQQQAQIQTVLALWKECSSADPVENGSTRCESPHRAK